MYKIDSFLSARMFLQPQKVGNWIYFLSNLSGHISLYRMKKGGSIPQPLIPPEIALQNPYLIDGQSFFVFQKLGKILVMMDQDGDENYQPMFVPIDGGYPEHLLDGYFQSYRCHLVECDPKKNIIYLANEEKHIQQTAAFQVDLKNNNIKEIFRSSGFAAPAAHSRKHEKVAVVEGYSTGDEILYLWNSSSKKAKTLLGTPLEDRRENTPPNMTGINAICFTPNEKGLLASSAVFSDTFSIGYLPFSHPKNIKEIKIIGLRHKGMGELEGLTRLGGNAYSLLYNIDGISWLYQTAWDQKEKTLTVEKAICGKEPLKGGKLESFSYEKKEDEYCLSFSSAKLPTQIYLVRGGKKPKYQPQTGEKVLGVPDNILSNGEDASFTSFDGLRISARLYRPSEELGFGGPRPLVYYVHGGPQGQERPDFAWFSMPLIQYLTLKGFAVFVPNVRGSTGYGLKYTKLIDRDWGGNDRLDHVHALKMLAADPLIDTNRAGVVGRSYGGYMSLTLAGRHPDLWKAAVDMFGPYDLLTFLERIPESWKPVMKESLGDSSSDREFLIDRSPKTHLTKMTFPLLVIQGKHDPRVVAQESKDLVENLKKQGKKIELILFEDEGHDVLKFKNRIRCYEAITEFFIKFLEPGN